MASVVGRVGRAVDKASGMGVRVVAWACGCGLFQVWVRFRAVEQADGAVMLRSRVFGVLLCQLARDAFLGTSTACYTSLGSIFKAADSDSQTLCSRSASGAQHAKGLRVRALHRATREADLRPALRGEGGSAPSRQLVLVQIATSREGSTMASVITCPKDRA